MSAEAITLCNAIVKEQLKAPKTAKFKWIAEHTFDGKDLYTVKSYVDSENSFGAMIRTHFLCGMRYRGEDHPEGSWQMLAFETY